LRCQRYVPHDLTPGPPVSTACAHAPTREVALVALEGSEKTAVNCTNSDPMELPRGASARRAAAPPGAPAGVHNSAHRASAPAGARRGLRAATLRKRKHGWCDASCAAVTGFTGDVVRFRGRLPVRAPLPRAGRRGRCGHGRRAERLAARYVAACAHQRARGSSSQNLRLLGNACPPSHLVPRFPLPRARSAPRQR